ncbi:hypothetical protein D3C72_975020 [compost metagenome]
MPIGAQFEAVAPMILATPVVLDAAQVAQAQLRALVVRGQLGLDLPLGIVEHQMTAAGAVMLTAANAGQRMLMR